MTIQELHIENNGLRDLIEYHKRKIAELDAKIRVNEASIGSLMAKGVDNSTPHMPMSDCELCMGDCNANSENY